MEFQAFHVAGFGRLVVCSAHATDVLMWLWQEADGPWGVAETRHHDRTCALCNGKLQPIGLRHAVERQGRPIVIQPLKRAA